MKTTIGLKIPFYFEYMLVRVGFGIINGGVNLEVGACLGLSYFVIKTGVTVKLN